MELEDRNETANPEKRNTRRGKNYFYLGWVALLFAAMSYLFFQYPRRSIGPMQPIFFSHRVHAGVKAINCRFCHPFVSRSQNAGLPAVKKCFFCHQYIIPQYQQIVQERWHYDTKTPVPWLRIYFVPDYVYFQHSPHINRAKIDCAQCHGDVTTMDRLLPVNFEMGFCIGCHRKRNGPMDCWLACHR